MSSVVQIPRCWKLVLSPTKHPPWCVDSQHLVYISLAGEISYLVLFHLSSRELLRCKARVWLQSMVPDLHCFRIVVKMQPFSSMYSLHLIFANTFLSLEQRRYVGRLHNFVVLSVVLSQCLERRGSHWFP